MPAARDLIEVEGRPGIVMERVDGPALTDVLARTPWRLFSVARELGEVHAKVNSIEAPRSLLEQREFLRTKISIAGPELPPDLAGWALEVLDGLPDGDRLCHGDYHVSNVLAGRSGGVVIDWTNVTRGHPTGDHARSVLLTSMGEVPPGTPKIITVLRRSLQGVFNNAYQRAYRRGIEVDDAALDRWKIVHVAARFGEGIVSEFLRLREFLEARAPR